MSDWENEFYLKINRSVWPDDVRENFEEYQNIFVGWAGIVEKYMTETNNEDYNLLGLYIRHHYYDWIEDFFYATPINLSPNGEGYFVCYFIVKKDFDLDEYLSTEIIGDLIINYGYPSSIDETGTIIMTQEYMRRILKEYVNPKWFPYGRRGMAEYLME